MQGTNPYIHVKNLQKVSVCVSLIKKALPGIAPFETETAMNIHESAEDYLETILILKNRLGQVRSIDIVREMNFSKPSISIAMKRLRENGYIEMDAEGYITLLPPGLEIAQNIYARHQLLTEFLIQLGVSPETAAVDACKIEHDISQETYQKILEESQRKREYQ